MNATHPWPARLALATFVAAIPLIALGGKVTTLGAGMAVEGWLIAEGHFLPLFPFEKWFRDYATFAEHTHRMFGMAVGLLAVATLVSDLATRIGRRVTLTAVAALVAVSIQGWIGGSRVLENSPELARLHGLIAQIVFAILACSALVHGRRWRALDPARTGLPRSPANLALVLAVVVFAQIVVGVYYRHGLRPVPLESLAALLHVHLTLAAVVLGLAIATARAAKGAALGAPDDEALVLRSQSKRLHVLVGVQIVLGLVAWLAHDVDEPERVTQTLLWSSLAHVTFGALLFAQAVVTAIWTRRLRTAGA